MFDVCLTEMFAHKHNYYLYNVPPSPTGQSSICLWMLRQRRFFFQTAQFAAVEFIQHLNKAAWATVFELHSRAELLIKLQKVCQLETFNFK